MPRMVEVCIYPDGTVAAAETLVGATMRRALLTILDEPASPSMPLGSDGLSSEVAQSVAALRAAEVLSVPDAIPAELEPLSEAALDVFWATLPAGTPLSQLIDDARDEWL